MKDQRGKILSEALALTASANESMHPLRRVPDGTVETIVDRSLSLTTSLPFSIRQHLALRDTSDFITISQKGHGVQRISRNVDLLPIGHPLCTRKTRMSEASLRESQARWVSSDPFISSDEIRSLVAAAHMSDPGTIEYEYYLTRIMSLPQGTVPIRALVAAFGDGNSRAARSMRARLQRRDRKGRFAWMGGGMSAFVRRSDGKVYRLTGRTLAQGGAMKNGNTNTFDIETVDGKIYRVRADASEGSKAFLPSPNSQDGYSPIPAKVDSSDKVMNESEVQVFEAPGGFSKSDSYQGPGTKYTDDAYDVYKLDPNDNSTPDPTYGDLDFDKPVYVVRREGEGPKSTDTVVQTWAEVMDFIRLDEVDMDKQEGRTPSIVAQLSDEQLEQLEAELGDSNDDPEEVAGKLFAEIFGQPESKPTTKSDDADFAEIPEGAYVPEINKPYEPEGITDQESTDYTDDPVELANRTEDFSNGDLIDALKGGVLGTSKIPSNGLSQLPFNSGDEYVPAEAIYEALNLRGEDAKARLADIYDTQLKGTPNRDALKPEKPKAEIKEKPEEKKSELPPLLKGLSKEEIDRYNDTGDYTPFLPKNEAFLPPEGYYPMDPGPFENVSENPDIDPINLANTVDSSDLADALRESLVPDNEGMGSVLRKDEDGEDVRTSVPAEALRDALQLQGEETNKLIGEIYKDAEEKEVPKAVKKEGGPQPIVKTAVSEEGKYYSVKPNGEIDKKMQYTDEYIQHLFTSPSSDLTLSELSDIEVIHSQLPSTIKIFSTKAVDDAKKELQLRDLGINKDKETSNFDGDRYVGGGKGKERKPKKAALEGAGEDTVEIPKKPHIATVKTSELMLGDVTTKDNFVIEEVYFDEESLKAKGKPGGGMWVVGHYPGHVSQKTKIWAADTPIEVYRGVDAPAAGDKPELSKPKTDKYQLKNGGKGMKKIGPNEYEPKDPADKKEYLSDLAEYEKQLKEAQGAWSPPDDLESYESSDFALSVDPKNPVLITTVTGPDLNPGDVAFKKEHNKNYFEYFVVESVDAKDNGTVEVTGYYPGHETQVKTWQSKTPITVMRGINEDQMPSKGSLSALERPKKGDKDYAEKKKAFDEAKEASASTWSAPEGLNLEVLPGKKPKQPKDPYNPPFTGPKMKEILDEADGDPAKVAELLDEQEVIYFDFETDGNGKVPDQKPIQVAAYKYKNGEVVDEFVAYMNPGTELGPFYTNKDPEKILKDADGNPISNEFLSAQQSREEAIQGLLDFMGPEPIVAAHNSPFDVGILTREAKEFGVDFVPGGVIDTLSLSRGVYDGPKHTLQDVAARYLLADESTDWHDARADAAVLEGIVFSLLDEIAKTGKGKELLDFELQESIADADRERYEKQLSEYEKQFTDYEVAKVVNDGLAGKEIPDNAQELIDKVNQPKKISSDKVGPNDPVEPQNIEVFEPQSLSINGVLISESWVEDPENTTELLGVKVEDWKVGDFYGAHGGGWWEIIEISQSEEEEKRMKIFSQFAGTGNTKEHNYVKYHSYPIRRPNENIEGTEPEIIDPPFEGASEPPKPSEDEVVGKWEGFDVVKGSDGIHYIQNIDSSTASKLKHKQLEPPALPLFVPLNGGNDRETGEGHYYDTNGGLHYGKYGASGALLRRLNSDGEYEYLLGLRKASQSTGGNTWAFPSGAHKNFEDSQVAEKTAKIEFMEEVGEDISGLTPLNSSEYSPAPDWKFDAHLYEVGPGQIDNPTPKDGENQKFGWFTKDQIKQLQADGKLHPEFSEYAENIFDLEGPSATPTPDSEKETESTPSEISLELPVDTSGWIKGEALGGSNGARLYTDPKTGEEYVVKIPQSEAHARNEVLASALYEAGGVKVGRVFLGKDSNGETILISPFVSGSKEDLKERKDEDPIKQSAYEGFVLDAWMNNYDSVGLVFDNMVTVGDDVYRIDPGGALLFRAQGKSKKDQLTPEATQLDTLRDPKVNASMGAMFGDMTDADLNKSADALRKITPEQIDSMVDKAFADVSPADAEFLKERLKARREDILSRFPEKAVEPEAPAEETAPEAEAPEPSSAPPAVSDAIDAVIKDVKSFENVSQLEKYLNDLEGTEVGNDPQVQELIQKIKDAQIISVTELPDLVSKEEAKNNDVETTSIDDELDGIESSLSSDEIEETYNPENPDQIIDSINFKFPGSENGDGTWDVITYEDSPYKIVVEKNKDNTFSVIYVKENSDGSTTKVDKYGTYHSYKALENRIKAAAGKLTSALISADGDESKMDAFFAELAKKTYWSTTGKSKVNLLKIKITHPSPDGATEINKGDRIWDSKTGKFGKVMYRFTVFAVKSKTPGGKPYVYTDYVRIKWDEGGYTNASTALRIWKVGSDEKIIAKTGSAPEFFPNPGTYVPPKTPGTSGEKKELKVSEIDPKPSPEVLESPTETWKATWEDEFGPTPIINSYEELVEDGLTYDKNSVEMFSAFGASTYNEYKEAIQGKKVKESTDKNILPSFLVEDSSGSIGIVTSIDPNSSDPKASVSWIFGDKAGTSSQDISPKELTSKESYIPPITAKSIFGVSVDTSIQESAKQFSKDKFDKMSEAQKKKAEADAAAAKAQSALVSGPGFDPISVEEKPSWDSSIGEAASVNSALEKIKKSEREANNGADVLIDADQIEGLRVRVTQVKNITDEVKTRLRFKLTDWAGNSLVKALTKKSGPEGVENIEITDGIQIRKFETSQDPDAIRVESGVWKHYADPNGIQVDPSKKGRTIRLDLLDDDGNVFGYVDIHRANKTGTSIKSDNSSSTNINVSNHNEVDLYLNGDATPEDIERALERLGISGRAATQQDVDAMVENKIISLFGGFADPSKNLSGEERKEILQKIESDWGISPSNVEVKVVDPARGTIAFQMPREVAEKIANQTSIKTLAHTWTGGSNTLTTDLIYNLFFGNSFNSSLLPTDVRMGEGINKGGMSSTSDNNTVGADYVFFSGQKGSPEEYADKFPSGNTTVFAFDIVDLIQNFDWYVTYGDKYGQRVLTQNNVNQITNFTEFMARDAVPISLVKGISLPSNVKSELKKRLQAAGITEWNGIPVDKLFGLTNL